MEYHKEHGNTLKEYYCNYAKKPGYKETCEVVTDKINKIKLWDDSYYFCNNCYPYAHAELKQKEEEQEKRYSVLRKSVLNERPRKYEMTNVPRKPSKRDLKSVPDLKIEMKEFIKVNAEKYTCNEIYSYFFKKHGRSYSKQAIRMIALDAGVVLKKEDIKRKWSEII